MQETPIVPLPNDLASSTIRFGLTYRQFRLPPVGDEPLMDAASCLQVEVRGEVSVSLEVERGG